MILGLGWAIFAFLRSSYQTGRAGKRWIFEHGQPVLQETFDKGQTVQESKQINLTDDTLLEGRKRTVKIPRKGQPVELDYYDVLLTRPDYGITNSILSTIQEPEALNLLLHIQRSLELPVRLTDYTPDQRPLDGEGQSSNLSANYNQSFDKLSLRLFLGRSLRRVPLELVVLMLLFGGMALYYFYLWYLNGGSADWWFGAILAGLAILTGLGGAISLNETDEVVINSSGITWKGAGQSALTLPLSEFREMAILPGGLYCFVGTEIRDLLEGTHSRDERCYLYSLINSTLIANGEAPFEGAFGSRNLAS
ncbi:MAG: hypothetical protein WC314_26895 [Vulcanimicrobiota bacterium]